MLKYNTENRADIKFRLWDRKCSNSFCRLCRWFDCWSRSTHS